MEVGTYEARTHLPELLARVRRGERVIITRHGQTITELGPVASTAREVQREAFVMLDVSRARLRAARKSISPDEILSAIRELRR